MNRLALSGLIDRRSSLPVGIVSPAEVAVTAWSPIQLAPHPAGRAALRPRLLFAIRVLRADLSNFFMLQYRSVDGFLITGKNSGTHWLKFMLSCAIARQFQVPPPGHASGRASDAIIGHPRHPRLHRHVPRIGSSHTIPSIAFAWRVRLFDHPPVVVFVRDIREAMLSNYLKWQHRYDTPLSGYVRGDPSGKRYIADIWWYIHFFNRWGAIERARPGTTLIVRYEDMQAAPAYWLRRISTHLRLNLSDAALDAALAVADSASVQTHLDAAYGETIIPDRADRARIAFSPADTALIDATLGRHLRHTLGYDCQSRPIRRVASRAIIWLRAALAN